MRIILFVFSIFIWAFSEDAIEHNMKLSVELQRMKSLEETLNRTKMLWQFIQKYVLFTGKYPTSEDLQNYYSLNDENFRNTDAGVLSFDIQAGNVMFSNFSDYAMPERLQKLFQREGGTGTVYTMALGPDVMNFFEKATNYNTEHGAYVSVSNSIPLSNALTWLLPDGEGSFFIKYFNGTEWVQLDRTEDKKSILPDGANITAVRCATGMSIVKSQNDNYIEYVCSHEHEWIPISMARDYERTYGNIQDIIDNHMDDPVDSVMEGVVIPARDITIRMTRYDDFWYGKDTSGVSYIVAEDISVVPIDNIKEDSLAWEASTGLRYIYKKEVFDWVAYVEDLNEWKRVYKDIKTKIFIESENYFFEPLAGIRDRSVILGINNDRGFHLMTLGTQLDLFNLPPASFGLGEGVVIKDIGINHYDITTKVIKHKNVAADLRLHWTNNDPLHDYSFIQNSAKGEYLAVWLRDESHYYWYRSVSLMDNYETGYAKKLRLRYATGTRTGDYFTHPELTTMMATTPTAEWQHASLYADEDGGVPLSVSIVKFIENGAGQWAATTPLSVSPKYYFTTVAEAYGPLSPAPSHFDVADFGGNLYLRWNSVHSVWVHAIATERALVNYDYVNSDGKHQIKFSLPEVARSMSVSADGSLYYSDGQAAQSYHDADAFCSGVATSSSAHLPALAITTAGGGSLAAIGTQFMWTQHSAYSGVHTVYNGLTIQNGDDTLAFSFRCVDEFGNNPSDHLR
jgi:hypothetical protein